MINGTWITKIHLYRTRAFMSRGCIFHNHLQTSHDFFEHLWSHCTYRSFESCDTRDNVLGWTSIQFAYTNHTWLEWINVSRDNIRYLSDAACSCWYRTCAQVRSCTVTTFSLNLYFESWYACYSWSKRSTYTAKVQESRTMGKINFVNSIDTTCFSHRFCATNILFSWLE